MSDLTCFAFRGSELLVRMVEEPTTPALGACRAVPAEPVRPVQDFGDCQVADWPADTPLPEGVVARGLRPLHPLMDPTTFALAGKAFQLLGWARANRFCGFCGGPMARHAKELAFACTRCHQTVYPRLNPAMIVLVTRGREALLSRSPHFAPHMFSCQAGFVSYGESLEDAVRREVMEEVGVELGEVRYFGSQPWPFPNSLMIGFRAEWASGEIQIDHDEIEEARWWSVDALPTVPGGLSIARKLIDAWVKEQGLDPSGLGSPVYR